MEDSLIKPDVILVTKNVMVPLALPASADKFFPNPLSSKKKTKIVKSRKCRTLPKLEDICNSSRHRRDKSNEKTIYSSNYLRSNCNSSVHFGEENHRHVCSQEFMNTDARLKNKFTEENSKSKSCLSDRRQDLLSESFPTTTERNNERKELQLPRSSRSLVSNKKSINVKYEKKEELALEKTEENHVEIICDENEEPEVLSYKIKRKHRKILLLKSEPEPEPESLIVNPKDDTIEDNTSVDVLLEKSQECVAQSLPDEIQVISNQIKPEISSISIPELHKCISEHISCKPNTTVETEESKLTPDNKCEIKYSWQDLDNWVPPSQKKNIAKSTKYLENSSSDCKIKYSWQIIGTCAQTSDHLLEDYLSNGQIRPNEKAGPTNYPCAVKYSWQIIGTATQVSFSSSGDDSLENDEEYWSGNILTPSKRSLVYDPFRNELKKIGQRKIMYNEGTQTFAEKSHQTDMTDCRAKYSWQNLTKTYLASDKLP